MGGFRDGQVGLFEWDCFKIQLEEMFQGDYVIIVQMCGILMHVCA